ARQVGLKNVFAIEQFKLHHSRRGTSAMKTVFRYFQQGPEKFFVNAFKFHRALKDFKPDLVISDMEPFSYSWAKWREMPLWTINNQSLITLTKFSTPTRLLTDYFGAKTIVNLVNPPADFNLVLSFCPHLTPLRAKYKKRSFLAPPILRKELFSLTPKTGNYVLIYQTNSAYHKKIRAIVNHFPQIKFYIYNLKNDGEFGRQAVFKKFSSTQLLEDLAGARAVILNGGFTVLSEAIYLKKPIISLPMHGDFEQILNAILLDRANYGIFLKKVDLEKIENFFDNLDFYERNLQSYHQNKNCLLEAKLKEVLSK
ncbi:MAG: hypothetical protein NTY61_00620, partial [Candidatus Parcubacteria bacterium]|nr:hypothetical protein [Candidatus Parcubacteria bacterium]